MFHQDRFIVVVALLAFAAGWRRAFPSAKAGVVNAGIGLTGLLVRD